MCIWSTPSYRLSRYRACKRILDLCGAAIGLVVLLVFLPILAFLIFIEDRGPIFYQQERIGLHGRSFIIYKFRSMVSDADTYFVRHPRLRDEWLRNGKLSCDPRVTRVGRLLRRTSLDELPQMINVWRGEMSLVGPRAVQPQELAAFGPLWQLRLMVKPGITGLWQVSGRATNSYEQRCFLDCLYVLECSLKTDICILLRTFPAVIRGIGAY